MSSAANPPRRPTRGGQGGAEPRLRIRERETRAVHFSVRGGTQDEIAAELGISQPAVSKLLRRVDDRVVDDVSRALTQHKARQTVRLEHLYREAIKAWERS